MAYRYSASGTLEVPKKHVHRVCTILDSKSITYTVEGNTVTIQHTERALTPSNRPEEAFEELAPYIDKPQALAVFNELLGEREIGFVGGRVRNDKSEKVWSTDGEVPPTPDHLVDALRARGIACRVSQVKGSRKSGRRSREFSIQPGSGGPACKITIKRRFWDSYDLLSVPDIYTPLCRKYHRSPGKLREDLHQAKFGVEVRNPALGGPSSDLLFDNLLEVIEELTEGIRTKLG